MAYTNPYGYGQPGYPTYLPQPGQMAQYGAPQYGPQMGGMQMNQQTPQMQAQQPTQGAPLWVQGEAGAKSFLVAPGQSLILMDSEAEVFYIKATDPSGVPLPLRIFDYKERTTGAQRPVQAAQTPSAEYVTRAEFDALAAKFAEMTARSAPQEQTTVTPRRRQRETEGVIDG